MLEEKLPLKPPFSAFVTVVGRFAEGGEADGPDAGKGDGDRSAMVQEALQIPPRRKISGFLISVLLCVDQ
jgi:hypothetical protein